MNEHQDNCTDFQLITDRGNNGRSYPIADEDEGVAPPQRRKWRKSHSLLSICFLNMSIIVSYYV